MISKKELITLRCQAHHLKPVVMISHKGLTDTVQLEIERALLDHELIKIQIHAKDKSTREKILEEILKARDAILIHTVGFIATIYRKNPDS